MSHKIMGEMLHQFQALAELKKFMLEDNLPNKNRQKLLRNLRVSIHSVNI